MNDTPKKNLRFVAVSYPGNATHPKGFHFIMFGDTKVAQVTSRTMALRLSEAANEHKPDERGR